MTRFASASGWRGAGLVFAVGAVAALAMPPTDFWWLLFIAIPVFLIRFATVTAWRRGFAEGWLFGFGYFCVALHWIGFAFLIDAKTYLWMMPFAVGGLAAVMALYWGLAGLVTSVLQRRGVPGFVGFPAALAVCEWLRGHLMTGFPWAAPGLAADGMGPVVQLASLIGMPGLTLLLVAGAASLTMLQQRGPMAHRLMALWPVGVLVAGAWWGHSRLEAALPQYADDMTVRVVQPNTSQDDKWRADNASAVFDGLVAQSVAPPADRSRRLVVWPESAVPFLLDESEGARRVLAEKIAPGQFLFAGAIRRAGTAENAPFYTSILAFDDAAMIVATYDKWRLVPGGEFLPFSWLLEPLGFQKLVSLPGSFTAGSGPETITIPGLGRFGLLICYEVIFPHGLVDAMNRPQWLVNVTNDGWFGTSSGPHQHFAQARLRAIEQGLPVIRSANTGISGVIDAHGRIVAQLGLLETGVVDSRLPMPIQPTVYARYGDFSLVVGLIIFIFLQSVTLHARKLFRISPLPFAF